MLICPKCNSELYKNDSSVGLFWVCPSCNGRAMAIEVVKRAIPNDTVNKLWKKARSGQYAKKRRCPACTCMMTEVPIISEDKTEYIDVCTVCRFIWFDIGEYEGLSKAALTEAAAEEMTLEAREALAIAKLKIMEEEKEFSEIGVSSPRNWWELIPALFGIPIVYKRSRMIIRNEPVVTWFISMLIATVSIAAFFNLRQIVHDWGLVPAHFGRHFGLTFISSFFLHAGFFHLITNLYFLIVFGSNTEDVLGKKRFLLLIVLSAIVGDIAHILINPASEVPCIGASGGISGVLAYFCLRFPKAHVGIIYYYRWIRMPVRYMLTMWIICQILYAYMQKMGLCSIAATAHLGGAAVGVVFWLMTRKSLSADRSDCKEKTK